MNAAILKTTKRAEGIDTISIEFFPDYVNEKFWFDKRQISLGVSLEVRKSKYKKYYFCHIQAEALNYDIFRNVIWTVKKLYLRGFLIIYRENESLLNYIIRNRHSIFRLAELDFYFDFPRNALQIPSEEITGARRFPTTVYSKDHKKRKSLWIMYDRISDLLYRNQLPKDFVKNLPFPTRIEVRLCRANCAYLHLDNIRGDFYQIFSRYQSYIAKTWRKHGFIFGEIPIIEQHPFFNMILFLSSTNKPLHITGLEKTPRPLNKITEKELFNFTDSEKNSNESKDDFYNELYEDFEKYKVDKIQMIHKHCIYSVSK